MKKLFILFNLVLLFNLSGLDTVKNPKKSVGIQKGRDIALAEEYDKPYKYAYVAGGCFWGVEFLFENKDGVIDAVSGYMGGSLKNPTYRDVTKGNTGHLETVKITYNPDIISYREVIKFFFEIHDPTQADGQGPDIGSQYLSAVFISNEEEKEIVVELIDILKEKGYNVVTKVLDEKVFWRAELYHQDYYSKNGKEPYCHFYSKKF